MIAVSTGAHSARAQDAAEQFANDFLETLASEYTGALVSAYQDDATSLGVLIEQASKAAREQNWRVARTNLEKLIVRNLGADATWRRLAWAWRSSEPRNERAAAAAYRAYRLSSSYEDRLDALFVLGDVTFEIWDELSDEDPAGAVHWRALSKLVFAEIGQAVADDSIIAAKVEAMNEEGLRVEDWGLEHERRQEDGTPPFCVYFSKPIPKDPRDVRDFVEINPAVDGADFRIDRAELCIFGLDWGVNYGITLRGGATGSFGEGGFPAEDGSTLSFDEYLETTTPSALPSAGFNRHNYVLPTEGAGLIGLKSINVISAELALYRISDRALLRRMAVEGLGEILSHGELDYADDGSSTLVAHAGALVWRGDVSLDRRLNVAHSALLPAGDLIEQWESASRDPDAEVPAPPLDGEYYFDRTTRPGEGGALGPAAYAIVIQEVETPDDDAYPAPDDTVVYIDSPTDWGYPVLWMVRSDLGVSLMKGERWVHLVVRRLSDGGAAPGATVELLARDGRLLGTGTTDDNGTVQFERRLLQGVGASEFQAAAVYLGDDFGFLAEDADRLDLTELDVTGRLQPGSFDVYLAPERQIYRPDETVSALVLVRDLEGGAAPPVPPLEISVESESGLTAGSFTLDPTQVELSANGYLASIPIAKTAAIGPAYIRVRVAGFPEKVIAEHSIQIRHFRPDRATIELDGPWAARAEGDSIHVAGAAVAKYLYGAETSTFSLGVQTAPVEAWLDVRAANSPHPSCYGGFTFGNSLDTIEVQRRKVPSVIQTDDAGRITVSATVPGLPPSSRPREVVPSLHLLDEAGVMARLARAEPIPVAEDRNWVGIRVARNSDPARTGEMEFEVVSLDGTLGATSSALRVSILRERTTYEWSAVGESWDYQASIQPSEYLSDTEDFPVQTAIDENGCARPATYRVSVPAGDPAILGNYRVELRDARLAADSAILTSMRFRIGAETDRTAPTKPQEFEVLVSDGPTAAGSSIDVAATGLALASGEVLFGFVRGGEVVLWQSAPIIDNEASTTIEIPDEWDGSFVHVFATAFGRSIPGAPALARAVGLADLQIDAVSRRLDVALAFNRERRPSEATDVDVVVEGLAPQENAYAVLFAVDAGVDAITGYSIPDPHQFFHGPRAFPFEIQDVYTSLIVDDEGVLLGEGGGDLLADFRGEGYVPLKLAVQVLGPVPVEDGQARFTLEPFEIPASIKLTAIAWTDDRAGLDRDNLTVRDGLEVSIGAPGHAYPGDVISVPVTVRNIALQETEFDLRAVITGAELEGGGVFFTEHIQAPFQPVASDPDRVVSRPARSQLTLRIPSSGAVDVEVTVSHPSNAIDAITAKASIAVRDPVIPRTRVFRVDRLTGGETSIISAQRLAREFGLRGGLDRARVQLYATAVGRLPVATELLAGLETDESRNLENIASEGLLRLAAGVEAASLAEVLALQTDEGGFLPTPALSRVPQLASAGEDEIFEPLWRSALALDYLQYAVSKEGNVPAESLDAAKGFLATSFQYYVVGSSPSWVCRREVFFAALVLARVDALDRRSFEDIRECSDVGVPQFEAALLASALLAYGEVPTAAEVLDLYFGSGEISVAEDFGLEELSMSIALLAENQAPDRVLDGLVHHAAASSEDASASIGLQTAAWMARAEQGLAALFAPQPDVEIAVRPESASSDASSARNLWMSDVFYPLSAAPQIDVTNVGGGEVDLYALMRLPQSALLDQSGGDILIRRRIFRANGEELGAGGDTAIGQNELAIVLIEGTLPADVEEANLRLAIFVPSGFDIELSRLDQDTLQHLIGPGYELAGEPAYFEPLPDRLLLTLRPDEFLDTGEPAEDGAIFRYAFAMRGAVKGQLTVPETVVELIKDPAISGSTGTMRVEVVDPDS